MDNKGIMKYLPLQKIQSLAEDFSDRDVADQFALVSNNILFEDGKIKTRYGTRLFLSGLDGAVLGLKLFKSAGEYYLVFVTDKTPYLYVPTTKTALDISPRYSEGTASTANGDKTITGSGSRFEDGIFTDWEGSLYLGFGATYAAVTKWHKIESVTNDEELELETAWNNATDGDYSTGATYWIKYELDGSNDSLVDFAECFSASRENEVLVIINKRNTMVFYDPLVGYCEVHGLYYQTGSYSATSSSITFSGNRDVFELAEVFYGSDFTAGTYITNYNASTRVATLSATSLNASPRTSVRIYMKLPVGVPKHGTYGGAASAERLVVSNITDGSDIFEKRIMFSEIGEALHFRGGYYDINNSTEEVSALVPAKGRIYVFKKSSITELIPDARGTLYDPFNIIPNRRIDNGTNASKAIRDFGDYVIFSGESGTFFFDGVAVKAADDGIHNTMVGSVRLDQFKNMFSSYMKEDGLLLIGIPEMRLSCNTFYVYNTRNNGWSKWIFPWYFHCCERYRKSTYVLWSDYEDGLNIVGNLEGGTAVITNVNTNDLYAKMLVTGEFIPADTYISSVGSTSVTLTKNVTNSGLYMLNFRHTWGSMQGDWADYKETSEAYSYLFGSEDGNIYEMSYVFPDDDGFTLSAELQTKDYPVNDPMNTVKLLEIIMAIKPYNGYYFDVQVSTDYGETWTSYDPISQDGSTRLVTKQHGVFQRGRTMRLKISNVNGSRFEIDSVILGYNDSGERM